MQWKLKTKYCLETDEGYRISRCKSGEKILYVAWPPAPENRNTVHHALKITDSLEDAKNEADRHYQETVSVGK
jgi:hypothetical protein